MCPADRAASLRAGLIECSGPAGWVRILARSSLFIIPALRVIFTCGRTADGENLDQKQSGDKPADVRSISNATGLAAGAEHAQTVDDLEDEPQTDCDKSGNRGHEIRNDYCHLLRRKKQQVPAQHA